jgi:hypothetical protein
MPEALTLSPNGMGNRPQNKSRYLISLRALLSGGGAEPAPLSHGLRHMAKPDWEATAAATRTKLQPLADEAVKRHEEALRRALARIP